MPKPRSHQIPLNALKKIAEQIIDGNTLPRSKNRWPTSKAAALRRLMKQDSAIAGRVHEIYARMQCAAVIGDLARDGYTLRPEAETGPLNPVFEAWTADERRAWRITWARETVNRSGGGCKNGWGGEPTAEELETARKVESGELKPVAHLYDQCVGPTIRCEPETIPDGWTTREHKSFRYLAVMCSGRECDRKTHDMGHFHHELFPVTPTLNS